LIYWFLMAVSKYILGFFLPLESHIFSTRFILNEIKK